MSFVEILTALSILSMLVMAMGYYVFLTRNIRALEHELIAIDLATSLAEKIVTDRFDDFRQHITNFSGATLYDETKEVSSLKYSLTVEASPVPALKVHYMNLSGRVIEADMVKMLAGKLFKARVKASWADDLRKKGERKEFFIDLVKGAHEAIYE
jgi:hypothetical protein